MTYRGEQSWWYKIEPPCHIIILFWYHGHVSLSRVVCCCCAAFWRSERPVRQRVPTKMFVSEWTKIRKNPKRQTRRETCPESPAGNLGDWSEVTRVTSNRLLPPSDHPNTSRHSAWQSNQTLGTHRSGPVSVHWFNPAFVVTCSLAMLWIIAVCREITSWKTADQTCSIKTLQPQVVECTASKVILWSRNYVGYL